MSFSIRFKANRKPLGMIMMRWSPINESNNPQGNFWCNRQGQKGSNWRHWPGKHKTSAPIDEKCVVEAEIHLGYKTGHDHCHDKRHDNRTDKLRRYFHTVTSLDDATQCAAIGHKSIDANQAPRYSGHPPRVHSRCYPKTLWMIVWINADFALTVTILSRAQHLLTERFVYCLICVNDGRVDDWNATVVFWNQ